MHTASGSEKYIRFGLTLPQRAVLFGATTIAELLRLAGEADRSALSHALQKLAALEK